MSVPLLKYNKSFIEAQLHNIRNYGQKLTLSSIRDIILSRKNVIAKTSLHTFYVQSCSVYYINRKAFVFYIDDINKIVYYNTQLPFKWQRMLNYYYNNYTFMYITSKEFEQFYLLTVDDVVFKNIKHKREALICFQMSLKPESETVTQNNVEFSDEDYDEEDDEEEDEYDEITF